MTTDLSTNPAGSDDPIVVQVAGTTHLLVASDFDGVLAPLVPDPADSTPLAESIDALAELAEFPATTVAIVSGREVRQLRAMVPGAERFILIGSHGAEVVDEEGPRSTVDEELAEDQRRRLVVLTDELRSLAGQLLGLFVEEKQMSVAVHFRRVADEQREAATRAVDAFEATWPGRIVRGKEVVEFAVGNADKGQAVAALADRIDATATVYLGDDVTDEDVFAVLGENDLGVKVGPGSTAAARRVASPAEVARLLDRLRQLRRP